jgi:hypothetical protein
MPVELSIKTSNGQRNHHKFIDGYDFILSNFADRVDQFGPVNAKEDHECDYHPHITIELAEQGGYSDKMYYSYTFGL